MGTTRTVRKEAAPRTGMLRSGIIDHVTHPEG
jgi:hypothetical protein